MYSDDAKMIAEMLRDQWSLGPQQEANITYIPEQIMVSARVGNIFVYRVSRNNRISTTDYQTLQRQSNLSIKVSTRFRENHFAWCEEVYRILLANRRKGHAEMGGWLFLEITNDRSMVDLSGWYTTTIDIRLTTYAKPIHSAGFGDRINKIVEDIANHNTEGTSP